MKLPCSPPQTHTHFQTFAYTPAPTWTCKHKHKQTNRGGPDSLFQCLLDSVLLHLWPLPCVLFMCNEASEPQGWTPHHLRLESSRKLNMVGKVQEIWIRTIYCTLVCFVFLNKILLHLFVGEVVCVVVKVKGKHSPSSSEV